VIIIWPVHSIWLASLTVSMSD